MVSEPSDRRITIRVTADQEDCSIHGLVAVQLTFPVPRIRIEDAGSLEKLIGPVVEQAEAAGYRWNPPHIYVMSLHYGGAAYTSVHRSYRGARRRLTDCCADWGILDVLANSEMGEVGTPHTRVATGDGDDQLTYGIGCLEIEE
jgi:hypothetical protein